METVERLVHETSRGAFDEEAFAPNEPRAIVNAAALVDTLGLCFSGETRAG
jgi:hypothetical protein